MALRAARQLREGRAEATPRGAPASVCDGTAQVDAIALLQPLRLASSTLAPLGRKSLDPAGSQQPVDGAQEPEAAARSSPVSGRNALLEQLEATRALVGEANRALASPESGDDEPNWQASADRLELGRAQHAEQLSGLLTAMQAGATKAEEVAEPLDGVIAALHRCSSSLQSQLSAADGDAAGDGGESMGPAQVGAAEASGPVALDSAAGGAAGEEEDLDDDDVEALLSRSLPASVVHLVESAETWELREMGVDRLESHLKLSTKQGPGGGLKAPRLAGWGGGNEAGRSEAAAPAEAEEEACGSSLLQAAAEVEAELAALTAGRDSSPGARLAELAAEAPSHAAPRFWARAAPLQPDELEPVPPIGDGGGYGGAGEGGVGEGRGVESPGQLLLAACWLLRECLIDQEARVALAALRVLSPGGVLIGGIMPSCSARAARRALTTLVSPLERAIGSSSSRVSTAALATLHALVYHRALRHEDAAEIVSSTLLRVDSSYAPPALDAARLRLLCRLLRPEPPPPASNSASASASAAGSRPNSRPTSRPTSRQHSVSASLPASGSASPRPASSESGGAGERVEMSPRLSAEAVLPLCSRGLRSTSEEVRHAAVDLLYHAHSQAAELVEEWLAAQSPLTPALLADLSARLADASRASRPASHNGRPSSACSSRPSTAASRPGSRPSSRTAAVAVMDAQ